MTDRELLELAAKAAGIEHGAERADCGISTTLPDGRHGHLPRWNPLEDDGDALRLACKLRLDIDWFPSLEAVRVESTIEDEIAFVEYDEYNKEGVRQSDHRAQAVRRAITRAAAEIGKKK